jgi:hypothetical protein
VTRPGRTDNTAWRRAKAQAISDAGGQCQLCGGGLDPRAPKNTPNATEVDHILELAKGGAPYDRQNLRAVHRWCHQRRDKGQPIVPVPAVWVPCPTCPDHCTHPPGVQVGSRCW